ncbi:MAG: nucleotidyltransferase domain-containing protein [Candidatus Edwardsbacteria bacterium]|nr:nucleotidyltransferase domain-containing protein [Candidatus Edwardsbacteria bacterium]
MEKQYDKAIHRIVQNVKPQKIILFGSRARGKSSDQSDYDICLLKAGVVHRRKLAQDIYKLLGGCRIAMDVIVETPERFSKLKENSYLIYREIDRYGKVIYEK